MINLNNFYILLVCCVFFLFFFITPTLINFIILCEIIWICFYNIIVYFGIEMATLTYLIYGILILCLATAESVIGLTLIMFKFILFGSVKFRSNSKKTKNLAYSDFLI